MRRVITVSLNGNALALEDDAAEVLSAYLDAAQQALHQHPRQAALLSTLEQTITDKSRYYLGPHKTVLTRGDLDSVIRQLSPLDELANAPASQTGQSDTAPVASRRLYRIRQGKQLAGVCNGLAAYFEVDPSWVRIGFLVFGLCWGLTVLVYLALVLILPVARTPQELAAAYGGIRQAREPWHRAPSGSMARVLAALLMLPLLLVFGGLAIAWIIALFVLITTGTLFGLFLPLTIPLWVTVLLLLMLFGIVTWPLRIVAQLLSSSSHHAGSGVFSFLENLVGIAALCALGYWAYHHVPAVSYWINELRNQLPMVLDPSTST